MSFATRLRQARESAGFTQLELAKKLGITKSAVGNYENGVSSPKDVVLLQIFDVLNVEPNFLFQDSFSPLSTESSSLSAAEQLLIDKFRALDARGQSAVLNILEHEYAALYGDGASCPVSQNA